MPTKQLPTGIRCLSCGGTGKNCEICNHTGSIEITECPLKIITPDIWEVIELAGFYEKGLPPVAGGALDQAYNFIQAAGFIMAEKENYKRELGIL